MNYVSAQGFGSNTPAMGEGAARGSANAAAAGEICFLTLNLGLPWLEMGGRRRVALAEHNKARLAAAPQLLGALDADVVALQEVYSPADRNFLARTMAPRYPFFAQAPRSRSLLGNGLMLLSRVPIVRSAFVPCSGAPWWLGPLWRQGFLLAEIEVPGAGRTSLINVHLAANLPLGDAEASASERNRRREIGQLLAAASAQSNTDILIGDFNASDQIHPANYRRIIEAGYTDAFAAANGEARDSKDSFTWDAANPANGQGRFRHAPSQRIDHVFVATARQRALMPSSARVVLRDRSVCTPGGERVCLSDHYGMLVTLAQQRRAREIELPL